MLAATHATLGGVHLVIGPNVGSTDVVRAVNNTGTAVGNQNPNNYGFTYRWGEAGIVRLLPPATQSGRPVYASDINDAGIVVGGPESAAAFIQPLVWIAGQAVGAELNRTASVGGFNSGPGDIGYIGGISNVGQIIGSMVRRGASGSYDGLVVVRWDGATATPTELPGLKLSTTAPLGLSYPTAIHDNGTTLGYSLKYDSGSRRDGPRAALRWLPGSTTPQRLDDLVPSATGDRDTRPFSVNAAGVTVGFSESFNGATNLGLRAVRWDAATTAVTLLGTLSTKTSGYGYTGASYVNDAGTAFGTANKYRADDVDLGPVAVRWDAGGTAVTELGNLGSSNASGQYQVYPVAFNRRGTAAGFTLVWNGTTAMRHPILWRAGETAATDVNTLLGPAVSANWTMLTVDAMSETGYLSGTASYDPDGPAGPTAAVLKFMTVLVPDAGTYGQGDATIDTRVDFDDLLLLAQHYGAANPTLDVHVADLNLDGATNFADLLTLAQHYAGGATALSGGPSLAGVAGVPANFNADWALAQSLVPEPTIGLTIGSSCVAFAAGVRRRRRPG